MNKPVVLITGALTGIGRATALAFAQEGSRVVISGRRDDAGEALVTELRGLGAEAEFVRADVRHEDDVRNLVDKTIERFGRLDVAVNNAGTEGKPGPLTEQSAETYAATFDTNVLGTILSLKHEMRVMLAQGHGNIVNLSSAMGSRGAAGAFQEDEMKRTTSAENKTLVLKAFDTLFNKRDYFAAERYWSPNYIQHSAHIEPGREGLFGLIKSLPPTLKYEPGLIVAEEEFVIVHGRFSGHGRPKNWIAADILRIVGGVLVEH